MINERSSRMIEKISTKPRSSTLIVLSTLTIIGSVLIIIKGLFTYYMLADSNEDRSSEMIAFIDLFYALEFLSCIGTITGAIFMIGGKKLGLLIYQISCVVYLILTVGFAIFCILTLIGTVIGILQIVYLIPSILFLGLYQKQEKYLS